MSQHIFYGCDIDLRHGAITKVTLDKKGGEKILEAQSIYRWGGKGSFTLATKDDFSTMMRWAQALAESILLHEEETKTSYAVYLEWDKARVHYRNSNKMATVQLAQAVGAFAGYLGPRVQMVTPREVKLILPHKPDNEIHFMNMISESGFHVQRDTLETFDTKGDYPDSIAAGLVGYRKYNHSPLLDSLKESNDKYDF